MTFAGNRCKDILVKTRCFWQMHHGGLRLLPGPDFSCEIFVGIQDRPYYSGEQQGGGLAAFHAQPMVMKLIIVNVVIFLIDVFTTQTPGGGHWLSNTLAVSASDLYSPLHWWKLLTAGFAHSPLDGERGPWHLAWNMYSLWLFGREVENKYGSREFLRFYLLFVVIASVVWAAVENAVKPGSQGFMYGASGAVAGVLLLFALNFPQRKFFMLFFPFPVPAWALAVFMIGADVMGASGVREGNIAFTAHLAGAAAAAGYFFSGIRLDSFLHFGGGKGPRMSKRRSLKVFSPGTTTEDLDREADRILAKLNASGGESLTPKERKTLEAYSKRMKQKHNS